MKASRDKKYLVDCFLRTFNYAYDAWVLDVDNMIQRSSVTTEGFPMTGNAETNILFSTDRYRLLTLLFLIISCI